CAVSATGHGEVFIRLGVAHEICARVRLGHSTLAEAVRQVVLEELPAQGGEGGVIAIDREGRIEMEFNCEGMFRASRISGGSAAIDIYRTDRR
ncbi:MAG TPA: isoaspartyl peptidase/L-asparaginase, partial [Steroidobacteraceae bacterium]|nr:isoaspartyl peptidase/L-asparaginase [Steroidobacteraceae bacterium]